MALFQQTGTVTPVRPRPAPIPFSASRLSQAPKVKTLETALTELKVPDPKNPSVSRSFSAAQIAKLLALNLSRFPEPNKVLYEIIGGCVEIGFDRMLASFEMAMTAPPKVETKSIYKLPSDVDTKLMFKTALWTKEENRYLADMDRARKAISVIRGVYPCKKCNSYSTASVVVQMRSADEPPTYITTCFACGKVSRQ